MKRNKNYEAAFTRIADIDEPAPEEILRERKGKRRLIVVASTLAVILVIAGATGAALWLRRDTPARQVERGIAFSANNSHVAAVIEFKRSLQEDPNQPAVRVLLGQELSLMADARGAEIEFRKAFNANYAPEKTMPLLATSLLHQGQFDKLIAFVNRVQVESPEANAELLSLRGSAYFALGREAEAADSWKAARDFVPGNPATVMAEARAFAARGNLVEASKILDSISADAPKVELFTLRGELAKASGQALEAVAQYQMALKIEPGNLFVRESLAQTLVDLGRYNEAADQVRRVILPMPNRANAQFIAALIAIGEGNFEAASDSIEKAVHLTPTDGRYQLVAGKIALQLGRQPEAEQHLRDAVTLLPLNVEARRLLSIIYVKKHEANRADDVFRPVFEAAPGDREIAILAARIAMLQGNLVKAARSFDRVDPRERQNADATILGSSLRIKAGDKAGGFAMLRHAMAAAPDNPDVDSALVMSHLTFSETKEAMAAWSVLAQKQPGSARTYNLLAAIDLARGDKAAARRSMQQAIDAEPRFLAPVSGLAMLDLGENRPDAARARFRKFIEINPTIVDATLLLVEVEKGNGNDAAAILGLLQAAQKANPRSASITDALVSYYTTHDDPKQALATAERGLSYAPDDAGLLEFVGNHALVTGENDRAISIFSKLMDQNGSSPDYPTRLGLAQLAAGRTEETLTAFRLGLSRQPYNQERQLFLVNALLLAGKGDEAARMLFEVSRLAPKSPLLPELESDVKLGLKQYPEAIASYKKALAQRPSPRLAIKTFNGLMTARLRGEANTFLADWLKAHPNDEVVRAFAGEQAMRTKDYAKASSEFRLLAAAHPNDPMVLNNLAWNLTRLSDPQALVVAEKAATIAPDNPSINDTLGWLLVERGDADRGLGLIEKASRAAPNELEIRLHLAKAQLKKGRNAEARATLESLVATAPESEEGRASRALLTSL